MGHTCEEDEPTLIDRALQGPAGLTCLAEARQRLIGDMRRNRFSSAKAARVYTSSIDSAVWAYLEQSSLRRIIYREHLIGRERSEKGSRLADTFVRETGATEGTGFSRLPLFRK
jgi:hypothetical protein